MTSAAKAGLAIDADTVVERLAKIAFSNIGDIAEFRNDGTITIDMAKAIEVGARVSVVVRRIGRGEEAKEMRSTEIRMPNKMRALHLLGKHLGLAFK